MGGLLVVLLLLLLGGGGALFYFFVKSGNTSASDVPVCVNTMPEHAPAAETWSGLEDLHQSDDFIPQDTVYSYYNPTPGMNCPNCDAENPSGKQFCMVCGSRLHRTKFT